MNNNTNDQPLPTATTNNKTTQETEIISLIPHKNVEVFTSLEQISASLCYLAQCDYITGNNNDGLTCDALIGRGHLLNMLSDGLGHLANDFAQFERQYNKHQQQNKQDKVQNEQLKSELQKLSSIKEKYQQLQTLTDKNSEQAQTLQQQIAELDGS